MHLTLSFLEFFEPDGFCLLSLRQSLSSWLFRPQFEHEIPELVESVDLSFALYFMSRAISLSWFNDRCCIMDSDNKSFETKFALVFSAFGSNPQDSQKFAYWDGSVISTLETT